MVSQKRNQYWFAAVLLFLGLIAPLFVTSLVWMTTLNIFFYYGILTISYNIVLGYTGLFSFCHVTFGAVGGYVSALLAANAGLSPFLTLIVGSLAAGVWARPRHGYPSCPRLLPVSDYMGLRNGGRNRFEK
jgi:ABC-type branched-subunit amino acid transport system permease subunit